MGELLAPIPAAAAHWHGECSLLGSQAHAAAFRQRVGQDDLPEKLRAELESCQHTSAIQTRPSWVSAG